MLLPIFCWLLVQMLVLLLAVLEVPLSANFPRPAEKAALYEMLFAQIMLAALLLPWLLRRATTAAAVAIASIPFVSLAAFLSSEQAWKKIVAVSVAVVAWIAALACWRAAVRSARAQMMIAAIAGAFVLSGPLLAYLRADFSPAAPEFGAGYWQWSPLMAVLRLQTFPFSRSAWGFFAVALLSGVITLVAGRIRAKIFKNPPLPPT